MATNEEMLKKAVCAV